ncbi:hypothetical protein LEMLEM_LOCUS16577, partial [Lemmus lemmus]
FFFFFFFFFFCQKVSSAKKKGSRWSVFGAQHSLRNRLVLPGVILSHYEGTLGAICNPHLGQELISSSDEISKITTVFAFDGTEITLLIGP